MRTKTFALFARLECTLNRWGFATRGKRPDNASQAFSLISHWDSLSVPFVAALLAVLCLLTSAQAGGAQNTSWRWIRVEPSLPPTPASWLVEQGDASVSFDGQAFEVTLFSDTDRIMHHYAVKGRVTNGHVEAVETQLNTDSGPRRYVGTLDKVRFEGTALGYDLISMTSDGFYIGIIKNIGSK